MLAQPRPAGVLRASPEVPEAELAQSGPAAGAQDVQPEGDLCGWSPQIPPPAKAPTEETGKRGPPLHCLAGTLSHPQSQPSHGFPEGRRPCHPPACQMPLEAPTQLLCCQGPGPPTPGEKLPGLGDGWGPVLPPPGQWGVVTALLVRVALPGSGEEVRSAHALGAAGKRWASWAQALWTGPGPLPSREGPHAPLECLLRGLFMARWS